MFTVADMLTSCNPPPPPPPPLSVSQIKKFRKEGHYNDKPAKNWHARESSEGLHLSMDMPGLGKEHVKISVEGNTVVVQGKSNDDEDVAREYSSRVSLPEKAKVSQIKAEMKNGVLKLFVPNMIDEGRADAFDVNVN